MPTLHSHLTFAHEIWLSYLNQKCIAIDATCGNGEDTLFIAKTGAKTYAFDIQEEAIKKSQAKTDGLNVTYIQNCHSEFHDEIKINSVSLIVYNLGYLPGGNKGITTLLNTTLLSLQKAMTLLKNGGLISLTCYPGHEEGAIEEKHLIEFAKTLSRKEWNVSFHQWLNRQKAPSFLLLEKQNS